MKDGYIDGRRAAISWLQAGKDFFKGIDILQKAKYKPILMRKLLRIGPTAFSREKLEYEIRIFIGMWADENDAIYDDETDDEDVSYDKTMSILKMYDRIQKNGEDIEEIPPIISSLIIRFAACYNKREKYKRELSEIGESNEEQIVKQRELIVRKIECLSDRITKLYKMYREFFENGIVPDKEKLNSVFKEKNTEMIKQEKEEDLTDLSVGELKKRLKNQQTKLTRARNRLRYQQDTIPENNKENPMPDCPEKVKYEKKVKKLADSVEQLKYRIAELE